MSQGTGTDARSAPGSRFSMGKALLHALLLFLAVCASTLLTVVFADVRPEAAGELLGYLTFPTLSAGFLLSWVRHNTSRALGYGGACLWCLSLPAFLVAVTMWGSLRTDITAAEVEAMVIGPETIAHSTLGFSLPHPGRGFRFVEPSDDLAVQLEQASNGHSWVLENPEHDEALVITVVKTGSATLDNFTRFTARFRALATDAPGSDVLIDSFRWNPDRAFDLGVQTAPDLYVFYHCAASSYQRTPAVIVCLGTRGSDPAAMADLSHGLAVQ